MLWLLIIIWGPVVWMVDAICGALISMQGPQSVGGALSTYDMALNLLVGIWVLAA